MRMERDMMFTWQKSRSRIAMAFILKAFLVMFLSLSVSADDSSSGSDAVLASLTDGGPWLTADSVKGSKGSKESKETKISKVSKDSKDPKLKLPKLPDLGDLFGGGDKDNDKDKKDEPKVDPSGTGAPIMGPDKPRFESDSLGTWRITTPNVGVSAMQLQTMPFDKIVWFDTTFLGPSALQWTPPGTCPPNFETNLPDCFVHCIEYDGLKDTTRPLTVCNYTFPLRLIISILYLIFFFYTVKI